MKSKFLPIFLIMVVCSTIVRAQIITTIAGTPTVGGVSGDGGFATSALCTSPWGLALNNKGQLIIGFASSAQARMVDTARIITTIAGISSGGSIADGIPATAAVVVPYDIAMDTFGNIYMPDLSYRRIRKIDLSGIIHTIAGTGDLGYSGDGGQASSAHIGPLAVALDAVGRVYFTDIKNCIRRIDTSGIIIRIAGDTATVGYSGDGGAATASVLNGAEGIAVDEVGNIYFADKNNNCVRKIDASGIITTVAGTGVSGFGGDGGAATAAKLKQPRGVAVDRVGNLYIADASNHRIRKVGVSGVITTIAGSGSFGYSGDGGLATAAKLCFPYDIAIDHYGNLYASDYSNYCIRFVQFNKPPVFDGGNMQTLLVCRNTTASVNTVLTATDIDSTQRLNWSTVLAPMHGTLAAAYSAVSLGLPLTPTGLYYSPSTGYTGPDTFKVRVTDGQFADTTTVYVNVTAVLPVATAIMGADSLCVADTIHLSDTSTGGIWHSTNTAIATVGASTGIVTGVGTGRDTIYYVVSNVCGTDTAFHPVYIRPHAYCHVSIPENTSIGKISIYPNPNTNVLHIESPITVKTVISNMEGKVVLEYNGVKDCDISSLPAGVYVTSLYDESGTRLLVQKIVKQ